MKYVVVKNEEAKAVKLTKPGNIKQAHNSLERLKGIGITDIEVLAVNEAKKLIVEKESIVELLKAKKDFEESQ
jgi:hypothetical protein